MPAIACCPRCTKQVAVPDRAGDETEVRCPLCGAEYKLADAEASDVPELVVIGGPDFAMQGDAPSGAVGPHGESDIDSTGESGTMALDFLHGGADPGSSGAGLDAATVGLDRHEGESAEDDGEPFGTSEHDSGIVAFNAMADSDSPGVAGTLTAPAKRARRKPGLFGQVVGIVVSGFVGLGLGYLVLRWAKPEVAEPIDVWLHSSWASVTALWPSKSTNAPSGTDSEADDGQKGDSSPDGGAAGKSDGAKEGSTGVAKDAPSKIPPPGTSPTVANPPQSPPAPPPATPAVLPGPQTVGIANAEQSLATLRDAMNHSAGAVNPALFMAACDLGGAVTMLENPTDGKSQQARTAAAELLREVAQPRNRAKISSYADQWIFSGKRKADKLGVLLVGRVVKISPISTRVGEAFETQLTFQGRSGQKQIRVLSAQRPDFHVKDMAAVLGVVVTDPANRLPWYTGHESQIVLGGVALKLSGAK